MLAKINRFHGYNSLNYVYRRGKIVRGPYCSMRFVPNRNDNFRIAVVISKKVAKSAPDRNRIRRRVYEAIRNHAKENPINQDIVVTIFNNRFLEATNLELNEAIKHQLSEIVQQA